VLIGACKVSPSLEFCEIACESSKSSIPVIQAGLPEDMDLEESDSDSESDSEPPTCNVDPGGELDPVEGYESCQACFGNDTIVAESEGIDGDDGDNGNINSNCSAMDALLAHLESPEDKSHHASSAPAMIHIPRAMIPTVPQAQNALVDLTKLLRPPRTSGQGRRPNGLTKSLERRLSWMEYFLWAYVNSGTWTAAADKTATFLGRGIYVSRKLREWSTAFILDREDLPLSKYGVSWTKSRISDEDLKSELITHLQSLGKYVTATAIIDYLAQPDVMRRYGLRKNISLVTAERWMARCGFRWTVARKGQYVDGHEREDVVSYRQNKFLPSWYALEPRMRNWEVVKGKVVEELHQASSGDSQRPVVVWFHDESIFYAHDRRKKRWIHVSEMPTPQPKGEGSSLMAADFVSPDYGWLRSPDGTESARILFRPGKGRDGYFSNDETIRHVEKAMAILEKHYPNEDHVFIFDNAPTHMKRPNDSLSARNMPKGCREWGVDVPVRDVGGQAVLGPNGKVLTTKARIANGSFKDGTPQEFYWPEGHQHTGKFKGMAQILTERGFDVARLKAQCKQCEPSVTTCCCRRILFNQPDFTNVETILESTCRARGFYVIFLPKFHCELNFIEQCWGYAKRVYHCYPPSSKESELEANVIAALDSIPLDSMRK